MIMKEMQRWWLALRKEDFTAGNLHTAPHNIFRLEFFRALRSASTGALYWKIFKIDRIRSNKLCITNATSCIKIQTQTFLWIYMLHRLSRKVMCAWAELKYEYCHSQSILRRYSDPPNFITPFLKKDNQVMCKKSNRKIWLLFPAVQANSSHS